MDHSRTTWMRQAAALALGAAMLAASGRPRASAAGPASDLAVHITSPLGRTGLGGPIRIVAQVQHPEKMHLKPVRFYVDQKLVGQTDEGPPFGVEWTDENPYEAREIAAEACDESGDCGRDVVHLDPLVILEESQVSSVLLEASVHDRDGRSVAGLTGGDFSLTEDGVAQKLDLVRSDVVDSTYTLLIDCSQSMSRRLDFVQTAADRLLQHLRKDDRVIVAPFTKTIGAITGPTADRRTVVTAIGATHAGGGTAIVDALTDLPRLLQGATGRQAVVLITDGYDEHSTRSLEDALRAVKAAQATLYVVGIGGVAGISIKGERALRQLAEQTGGRAFFPSREDELPRVHEAIAADVQQRYLLAYTPTNQRIDGAWRRIAVNTSDESYSVRTRPGYFAPKPPPVRATLEFVATTRDRQPVAIGAGDLEIFEDGVRQTIDTFQEAVAPISIVLALDASGSMKSAAEAVQDAAKSFVRALRPGDQLALMIFADEAVMVHDLTGNRQWTLDGIDQYKAHGGTALNDALYDALTRLKRVDGRRAIVVLTDGRDENGPGTAPGSRHTIGDVLDQIDQLDATVYGIGLGPKVDSGVLDRIAAASGGESFFPQGVDELTDQYRRVVAHLRQRYIAS
jgi:VWFA-related protein